MNVFKDTKIIKRIAIILVFLILFNFCISKKVEAKIMDDIADKLEAFFDDVGNKIKNAIVDAFDSLWDIMKVGMIKGSTVIFFGMEDGIMTTINNAFVDTSKKATGSSGQVLLSPETIIQGKFALMNANIFKKITQQEIDDEVYYDGVKVQNGKNNLRTTISGWYMTLRNFAIVALLSILVYVAIRMVISSVGSDKAKYKMMLRDWLVALCLVIFMHYMMVAMINTTALIINAISTSNRNMTKVEEMRIKLSSNITQITQITKDTVDNQASKDVIGETYGNLLIYAALITFTVIFVVKYVLRAITIMFLALIAPITAITYPIDKISDGKSQAYDFWFKEFFFNIMIQPFHLLLYTVLIGAASDLADSNIIYCILCYAVMLPAEKIIKQMFGFRDKLGSPLGAFAGGAALTTLANKARRTIESKNNNHENRDSSGESSGKNEDSLPPKQKNEAQLSAYEGENNSSQRRQLPEGDTTNNSEEEKTAEQKMLDAYDENYGTDEWDAQERDSMARDAYQPQHNDMSQDEMDQFENDLREAGYNDDEIEETMANVRAANNSQQDTDEGQLEENEQQRLEQEELEEELEQEELEQEEQTSTANNREQNSESNQRDNIYNNQSQRYNTKKQPGKARLFARGIKAEIGRDVRKKYGTTKPGKLITRAVGKLGKTGLKLGMATFGGAALGAFALATGDVKATMGAVAAGAGLGSSLGKATGNVGSTIYKVGTRYGNAGVDAYKEDSSIRKKSKEKYMQNQVQRDYVTQRLADKNGGIMPSAKEVNQEMEKRWKFMEDNGITDKDIVDGEIDLVEQKRQEYIQTSKTDGFDHIEDMLSQKGHPGREYRKAYKDLNNGEITNEYFNYKFGSGEAEKAKEHYRVTQEADRRSFGQASLAGKIAKEYKKPEYRDGKKMGALQKSMVNEYMSQTNSSKEHATKLVNSAIADAAKIHGVKNPDIPGIKPAQSRNTNQSRQSSRNTTTQRRTSQTSSRQNTTNTNSSTTQENN